MTSFVPEGFVPPAGLTLPDARLEQLRRAHNVSDFAAWHGSIAHIRATPGFAGRRWPQEDYTLEQNEADCGGHEDDWAAGRGFTYTVLADPAPNTDTDPANDTEPEVVGCVYLYPPKREGYHVDVRSWVRADHAELDVALHDAVLGWIERDWPFTAPDYTPR